MQFRATMRDGVAVPDSNLALPNGTKVEIHLPDDSEEAELLHEMKEWEMLGDEAWALIERMEMEGEVIETSTVIRNS
jgi:hypothetical protein